MPHTGSLPKFVQMDIRCMEYLEVHQHILQASHQGSMWWRCTCKSSLALHQWRNSLRSAKNGNILWDSSRCPPTLPSSSQGRAAPGATLPKPPLQHRKLCLSHHSVASTTYAAPARGFAPSFFLRLAPSKASFPFLGPGISWLLACPSLQRPRAFPAAASWTAFPCHVPWLFQPQSSGLGFAQSLVVTVPKLPPGPFKSI